MKNRHLYGIGAVLGAALLCACVYTMGGLPYSPAPTAPLAAGVASGHTEPTTNGTATEAETQIGEPPASNAQPQQTPVRPAPQPVGILSSVPTPELPPVSPDAPAEPETEVKAPGGKDDPDENAYIDPVTGFALEEPVTTRPVAVMVDNVQAALPQRGLADAGILYEAVTEGGVTRLMAVYTDYKDIPRTGPVCAARDQYVQMTLPLRAMCVHAGSSEQASALLTQYHAQDSSLDGLYQPSLLALDDTRKDTSVEYCWFTGGDLLAGAMSSVDAAVGEETFYALPFGKRRTLSGGEAAEVYVRFSSYANSAFHYDAARGVYEKSQFGAPHIDENTGSALTFDNLLILFAATEKYPDGAATKFSLDAGGTGWYICGGRAEPLVWSKESADTPFIFTAGDGSGAPVTVNPGRTYIALAGQDMAEHFRMEAAAAKPDPVKPGDGASSSQPSVTPDAPGGEDDTTDTDPEQKPDGSEDDETSDGKKPDGETGKDPEANEKPEPSPEKPDATVTGPADGETDGSGDKKPDASKPETSEPETPKDDGKTEGTDTTGGAAADAPAAGDGAVTGGTAAGTGSAADAKPDTNADAADKQPAGTAPAATPEA